LTLTEGGRATEELKRKGRNDEGKKGS